MGSATIFTGDPTGMILTVTKLFVRLTAPNR
jgi:hypothetical protein